MGLAVVLLRRANRRRDYLSAASEALFFSGVCCANGKGPCITASMTSAHPGSLPSLQPVYTGPSGSLEPENSYRITSRLPELRRWWRIWGWLGSSLVDPFTWIRWHLRKWNSHVPLPWIFFIFLSHSVILLSEVYSKPSQTSAFGPGSAPTSKYKSLWSESSAWAFPSHSPCH